LGSVWVFVADDLRPAASGDYTVISEAYVHGVMDGELWRAVDEKAVKQILLE
jgi:hypothetical protein